MPLFCLSVWSSSKFLSTKPITPLVVLENSASSSRTAKFLPIKLSLRSKSSGGYPVNANSGNIKISASLSSAISKQLRIVCLFFCIAPTGNDICAPVILMVFLFTI